MYSEKRAAGVGYIATSAGLISYNKFLISEGPSYICMYIYIYIYMYMST